VKTLRILPLFLCCPLALFASLVEFPPRCELPLVGTNVIDPAESRMLVGVLVELDNATADKVFAVSEYLGLGHERLLEEIEKKYGKPKRYLWAGEILLSQIPGGGTRLRRANETSGHFRSLLEVLELQGLVESSVEHLKAYIEERFPQWLDAESTFEGFNEETPYLYTFFNELKLVHRRSKVRHRIGELNMMFPLNMESSRKAFVNYRNKKDQIEAVEADADMDPAEKEKTLFVLNYELDDYRERIEMCDFYNAHFEEYMGFLSVAKDSALFNQNERIYGLVTRMQQWYEPLKAVKIENFNIDPARIAEMNEIKDYFQHKYNGKAAIFEIFGPATELPGALQGPPAP
jgi:hypothetical protein